MRFHPVVMRVFIALVALSASFNVAQSQNPRKIIDLEPAKLGCNPTPFVGTSTAGLYSCSSAIPELYDVITNTAFRLPATTETVYSKNPVAAISNPRVPWFVLPQGAALDLYQLNAIPTSNTTIKIRMVALTNLNNGQLGSHGPHDPHNPHDPRDPHNPRDAHEQYGPNVPHDPHRPHGAGRGGNQSFSPNGYASILSMTPPVSYPTASMFSIGQNGSAWTYGRLTDTSNSGFGYWMTPWEPVDAYPEQTDIFEDVYYTFTTNGRLRMDMLTPYQKTDGTIGYVWEESIQDGGWPLNSLAKDINAGSNANVFVPSGGLILGDEHGYSNEPSSFGRNDSRTIPTNSQAPIAGISVFSAALTVNQMLADANSDFPSASINPANGTIYPCNSGYWLGINNTTNGTITTPCGTNSHVDSPVPLKPASVIPLDNYVSHQPQTVKVSLDSSITATVSWTAPATKAPPSGYTVYASGPGAVSKMVSAGTLSTAITGLQPSKTYQFYVVANYSGTTYDDVVSDPVERTMPPPIPSAPTNLVLTPGAGTVTATWGPPAYLPNPGPITYRIIYTFGSVGDINLVTGQLATSQTTITINFLPPTVVTVNVFAVDSTGKQGTIAFASAATTSAPYNAPQLSLPLGDYVIGSTSTGEVATLGNSGMIQNPYSLNYYQKWHFGGSQISTMSGAAGNVFSAYSNLYFTYYLYATGGPNVDDSFTLLPYLNGTYNIRDFNHGNLLWDSDSILPYGPLYLGTTADSAEKRFFFHPFDLNDVFSATYTITNVVTKTAVENNNPVNGNEVTVDYPATTAAQQWYISRIPGATQGVYAIINMKTGKVLDSRGYTTPNSPVGEWDFLNDPNQRWSFSYGPDGALQIKNQANGFCLAGQTTATSPLIQSTCAVSTIQRWILQLQQQGPGVTQ